MTDPANPAFISPEQAEKIRAKTIANVLKKISKGGTPTVAEQKILEDATSAKPGGTLKGVTCPRSELAELSGYSSQRLDQLAAEGVLVRKGHGVYDAWPSLVGLILHLKSKRTNQWDPVNPEGAEVEGGGGYEYHRARLTAAKADVAEINAMNLRNESHDAGAVAKVWGDMLMNCKTKLLALPTAMAGQVHGEESLEKVKDLLEEAVIQALNELSEYDPAIVTDTYVSSHRESVEAAAEVDDQPMGGQPPKAVKRGKRRARTVEDQPG